uniref:MYB transcription factor n=1 Tax=Melilotus albus TaxID=47082 RepID=A0A896W374_MELAB|nr:MYB family transcription factor [Melilotus albus]
MGNQKLKWTGEEEDALIAGIKRHGPGKWKAILLDPQFGPLLTSRSNIDLKDKWRNMNVGNISQPPRFTKCKAATTPVSSSSVVNQTAVAAPSAVSSSTAVNQTAAVPSDVVNAADPPPPPQNDQDAVKNNPPRYDVMVFEALSTLKDTNGSDLNAIASFIEQKHPVPQNFKKSLSARVRMLVNQGKLEKVQNCYKIKIESPSVTKSPSPKQKQKEARPPPPSPKQKVVRRPRRKSSVSDHMLKEAADTAAYIIAEAENKSYLATEAVKETERFSRMAEENDAMLLLAEQLYEQCLRGENIKWA